MRKILVKHGYYSSSKGLEEDFLTESKTPIPPLKNKWSLLAIECSSWLIFAFEKIAIL